MRTTLCLTTAALLACALPLQAADTPSPAPRATAPAADPLAAPTLVVAPVTLLGNWGMLIMGAYFGGRTVEKLAEMRKK
jgi:hypothetical protein